MPKYVPILQLFYLQTITFHREGAKLDIQMGTSAVQALNLLSIHFIRIFDDYSAFSMKNLVL